MTRALGEMGQRMETLSRELKAALERVQGETLRSRIVAELGTTLELDEILSRTADATASIDGVDAAVVHAGAADGPPTVAARGVPLEHAEAQAVSGPPDGASVRAVALSYHYREGAEPDDALRTGIAIPFETAGAPPGFLAVYSRTEDGPIAPAGFGTLETIAEHAGVAIANARRFEEARRQADLDSLTGLQNRRTFHEALTREVTRARGHNRKLTVCLLDIDDFGRVNESSGLAAGDSVLVDIAGRIREGKRPADVACRIGGDSFAVILPDSGRIEAEGLYARVQAMLRRQAPAGAPGISLSGGIAELEPDDDSVSLFARASAALQRAKAGGKQTAASG
jgi:diguanylate cyclase (GGDEF)-like protein